MIGRAAWATRGFRDVKHYLKYGEITNRKYR